MDLAKTLVRSVARSFYETKHTLIVDALVIHSALRDDDLAYLINVNIKDLHKMCQKLREDRLIASHSRSELREHQQRPINRTYYYIDYRQTIDAIKWRVYKIDKDLQGPAVPPSEKKEYFCDRCKAEWTQMEVLDNVGPEGFVCHRCGTVLRHGDSGQSGGHERSTRMNNQFKFITELLPKIDSVIIPDNTFDVAFNNKRPVMRDSTHQTAPSVGVDPMNRPTAVKGLANTGPSTLSVSIQAGNGPSEEEQAAERAHRERVAQQNALPSWMSNSTVTGEAFKTDIPPVGMNSSGAAVGSGGLSGKASSTTSGIDSSIGDSKNGAAGGSGKSGDANAEAAAIDDYFSRLKKQAAEEAQKQNKAAEEEEEDDDDDEDDDDEEDDEDMFEDVPSSAVGTPANSQPLPTVRTPPRSVPAAVHSTVPKAPSPLRQSHIQTTTGSFKRAASSDAPLLPSDAADRPAKKVKTEEHAEVKENHGVAASTAATKPEEDSEEEDDDDIEFEDV